jgi:hypothetical protein
MMKGDGPLRSGPSFCLPIQRHERDWLVENPSAHALPPDSASWKIAAAPQFPAGASLVASSPPLIGERTFGATRRLDDATAHRGAR